MKLSVIGCGYLGAVHAASMASLGHTVVGIDVDQAKIAKLAAGEPPFHEPGLVDVLKDGLASGRLTFSTDYADLADAEVHFIGVGTPQRRDGQGADMTYVNAATEAILEYAKPGSLIAGKSALRGWGCSRRLTSQRRGGRGDEVEAFR